MALNVKNKIWLGTLFLFLLLLLTGGVGIYYMVKLKNEAKNVLKDNYETLSYCHRMQQQLNDYEMGSNEAQAGFEKALHQQENNITEPGEGNATAALRAYFEKIKAKDTTKKTAQAIQN